MKNAIFVFTAFLLLTGTSSAQQKTNLTPRDQVSLQLAIKLYTTDFESYQLEEYKKKDSFAYLSTQKILNLIMQDYAKLLTTYHQKCNQNIWNCLLNSFEHANKLGLIDKFALIEIKKYIDPKLNNSGEYDRNTHSQELGRYIFIYRYWYNERKHNFEIKNPNNVVTSDQNFFILDRTIFNQTIFTEEFDFNEKGIEGKHNTLEELLISKQNLLNLNSKFIPIYGVINFTNDVILNPKRISIFAFDFQTTDPQWESFLIISQIHAHFGSLQTAVLAGDEANFELEKNSITNLISQLESNPFPNIDGLQNQVQVLRNLTTNTDFETISEDENSKLLFTGSIDTLIQESNDFLEIVANQYDYEKHNSLSDQYNLKYNLLCMQTVNGSSNVPGQKWAMLRVFLGKAFLTGKVGPEEILSILKTNGFFLQKNPKFLNALMAVLSYASIPASILDTSQITTILLSTLRNVISSEMARREEKQEENFRLVPRISKKECAL